MSEEFNILSQSSGMFAPIDFDTKQASGSPIPTDVGISAIRNKRKRVQIEEFVRAEAPSGGAIAPSSTFVEDYVEVATYVGAGSLAIAFILMLHKCL